MASRCSSACVGHWGGTGTGSAMEHSYVNFCICDDVDEQRPRSPPHSDGVCRDDGNTLTPWTGSQREAALVGAMLCTNLLLIQLQHHMTGGAGLLSSPRHDSGCRQEGSKLRQEESSLPAGE